MMIIERISVGIPTQVYNTNHTHDTLVRTLVRTIYQKHATIYLTASEPARHEEILTLPLFGWLITVKRCVLAERSNGSRVRKFFM